MRFNPIVEYVPGKQLVIVDAHYPESRWFNANLESMTSNSQTI